MMAQQAPSLLHTDVPAMLNCLHSALSSDTSVQRQAEAVLASLEHRPGFCSCLAEVIGDKSADHSARWLASVHLKNSVNRAWRVRSDQHGTSAEEKMHIRSKLSQLIPQEDSQIAVQVALVYAKIARFDYPKEWPTLFNDLLNNVDTGNTLMVRRVYLILHHVLKELSSKRLVADQKHFAEVAQLLLGHIWERWCADVNALLTGLPAGLAQPGAEQPPSTTMQANMLLMTFERWLLLLKILRRLILHGFESDAKSLQPVPAVILCVPAMVQVLQQMLGLRAMRSASGSPQRQRLAAMLDRAVLKLMKCQRQVLEAHPWSYQAAHTLVPLVEFCCAQLLDGAPAQTPAVPTTPPSGLPAPPQPPQSPERSTSFESFCMECMSFIATALTHPSYKGGKGSEQAQQMAAEVQSGWRAVWSPERLSSHLVALVHKYFPLTARDLDAWSSCPEEYHHSSDAGGWQEHLNLCAEHLYLILLTAHRDLLAPVVVQMLTAASAACPAGAPLSAFPESERVAGIPRASLLKEAVYNAVAVGAYELHDFFDFVPWLHNTLLQELNDRSPHNRPVRRRVAKLVANCVARLREDDRPPLYASLVTLLSEDDVCLQLAAVECTRALVDDWGFTGAAFVPFVGPTMVLLMRLIGSSTELDTQTQAFNLMNLIIERMDDSIQPYVADILAMLPQLWTDAEGQSLLRIQILLALQRLVNVLGPQAASAYPVVLPVLQYSLDVNQPEALNLMEDALALWLTALRHAPAAEPALLSLFPALVSTMASSTEHIQTGMQILSSCALLAAPALLQQHGGLVADLLDNFIGNVTEKGMLLIFPAVETLIQAAPEQSVQALQGPLVKLLALVLAGQESPLTQSLAMPLFARMVLHTPAAFMNLFQAAAARSVVAPQRLDAPTDLSPPEQLFDALLDLWVDRFDGVAAPAPRKLCALALARLLGVPSQAVLRQLDGILGSVTSVWYEQEGGGDGDRVINGEDYTAVARPGAEDIMEGNAAAAAAAASGSEDAEGEYNRRCTLYAADPVATLRIGETLREQLNSCTAVHGPTFHEAMKCLDMTIASQLKAALGVA